MTLGSQEPHGSQGPASGETFRHFRIEQLLGRGGMGAVYQATDTRLQRTVALKFVNPELAHNMAAMERFLSEARAAAALDHPNVGAIFDVASDGERTCLVLAFYRGRTLAQWHGGGGERLSLARILDLTAQTAAGLAAAHDHGIVHRDVKPANLMVTEDGTVKVLDFGLAKLGAASQLTRTGEMMGTLAYMAPEQARGQEVDARTDAFSLGAVLHELLTGRPPFLRDGGASATLLAILQDPPPTIGRDDLPPGLAELVTRLLAKDPNERPSDLHQVGAQLRAAQEALAAGRTAVVGDADPGDPGSEPSAGPSAVPSAEQPAAATTGAATAAAAPLPPLPAPPAPLVGRDEELALIDHHLIDPTCRLLTLVGMGGTGKSRLALEVAVRRSEARSDPDGTAFVALAGLTDPVGFVPAVAKAVGLADTPAGPEPLAALAAELSGKRILIVLDNLEHLADALSEAVAALLREAPSLRILATSRQRLELQEEWVVPLVGLTTPDADAPLAEQARAAAVQLLLQRAERAGARLTFGHDSAVAIGSLCRLLDGSPLGIELAAAWTPTLPIDEILNEVRSDADFLESSARDVPERHRSLRAVFAYSWRLLDPRHQKALARLSVFRGPFDRHDAVAVAQANLPLLTALTRASVLNALGDGRFDFHPLLRRYAAEMAARDEADQAATRDRHADRFLTLARDANDATFAAEGARLLVRVEQGIEDVEAAWRHVVASGDWQAVADAVLGVVTGMLATGRGRRFLQALSELATRVEALPADAPERERCRARLATAEAWLRMSVAPDPDAILAAATRATEAGDAAGDLEAALNGLYLAGRIHNHFGRVGEALATFEEGRDRAAAAGDGGFVAQFLAARATYAARAGERATAERALQDAEAHLAGADADAWRVREGEALLTASAELGDLAGALKQAQAWYDATVRIGADLPRFRAASWLGRLHLAAGRVEPARLAFEEALGLAQASRTFEATAYAALAGLHLAADDPDAAVEPLLRGLRIARQRGLTSQFGEHGTLATFVRLALAQDRADLAAVALGVLTAALPPKLAWLQELQASTHETLGDAFDAHARQGATAGLDGLAERAIQALQEWAEQAA